jgi:hypothetical protein
VGELDGIWKVERVGGALPPMIGVRKRIDGDRGATLVGRLRLPFDVRGNELHYRAALRGLVDILEPSGDDAVWHGRATYRGKEFGRFELRRIGPRVLGGRS